MSLDRFISYFCNYFIMLNLKIIWVFYYIINFVILFCTFFFNVAENTYNFSLPICLQLTVYDSKICLENYKISTRYWCRRQKISPWNCSRCNSYNYTAKPFLIISIRHCLWEIFMLSIYLQSRVQDFQNRGVQWKEFS